MSIYKYKFESILKYRKSIEKNKESELGNSIKKYVKEKKELEDLNNNFHEFYKTMNRAINDGITIEKLVNMAYGQDFYREGMKKKTISVENAANNVKKNRLELITAVQDKKIMERLKEIDLNNYKYEEQKNNEKNLDEIISFKLSSNIAEGK